MREIKITFREIPGHPGYLVSKDGMVVSLKAGKGHHRKFISSYSRKDGGFGIDLFVAGRKKKCKVHRLVAMAYLANPKRKPEVNHLNGDRFDNRVDNLEWVTTSENLLHANRFLLRKRGPNLIASARLDNNIPTILKRIKAGEKQSSIAKDFKVSASCISNIKHGKRSSFKPKYEPQERIYL